MVTVDTNIRDEGTQKHFMQKNSDSKNKYSDNDIINMLEFLVDSIFLVFTGKIFQQILIGTNCVPLLADIFLNSSTTKEMISISAL